MSLPQNVFVTVSNPDQPFQAVIISESIDSGGGGTLPNTTNLIAGDGNGGANDSGIAAANVVQKQLSTATPTTVNEIVAVLQSAGLCMLIFILCMLAPRALAINFGDVPLNTVEPSAVWGAAFVADSPLSLSAGHLSINLSGYVPITTTVNGHALSTNVTIATGDLSVSGASKLLGRGTGGAGAVQELTLGTNLSITGTTLNATGGGATTFTALTDVPNSYSGQAGKTVVVNGGETGLAFVPATGTGTVTTTGSPSTGRLTQFSGSTSITNVHNALGSAGFIKENSDDSFTLENASTHLSSLGGTNTGKNLFTLSDIASTTFLVINPDFSVTQQSASSQLTSLGGTTVGKNFFTLTNPSAITFPKIDASNNVIAESATTHRASIGATTVGGNLFTLTNPSAISFLKVNADNSVTAESAPSFRADIGAGTGNGTVTTTGAPASPNLAGFSGSTSITNMNLAGDVTTSGSATTTIAPNAVTYGKMQAASGTGKLIGSSTISSALGEITLGSNISMSGSTLNVSAPGATPAPSPTYFQYNNSGAFAGTNQLVLVSGQVKAVDANFLLTNISDPTKQLNFALTSVPTGTTETVIVPNTSNPVLVAPDSGATSNFLTGIGSTGVITKAQPTFGDIFGVISMAQNQLLTGNELWVDAVNGNDATGVRGDRTKPFQTISAALSAPATSGDVIYVSPGTYAQGTIPLVIPNVTLIGAGADFSTITTAVPKSSNRAGVEPSTGAAIYGFTIQNTASSGIPYGNGSASTAFTSAYIANCKVIGVSDGINITLSGSTGLDVQSTSITSQGDCFYSNVSGAITTIRGCILQALTSGSGAERALDVDAGTVNFFDGAWSIGNSTTTNRGVRAGGSGSTVTVNNTTSTITATGTNNEDAFQQSSATVNINNLVRGDGGALVTGGTVTDISRYLVKDNNLSDVVTPATARTNLGLAIGTNVEAWDLQLDQLAAISGTRGDIIFYGASGWTRLGAGTAGRVLTTQGTSADPSWTTAGSFSPSVDNLFTASQSVTLAPAANTVANGFELLDTTAASASNQQFSPYLHFQGQGWKTQSTAASQAVDFRLGLVPIQGVSNPSGRMEWASQINGGGYSTILKMYSGGGAVFGADAPATAPTTGIVDVSTGLQIGGAAASGTIPRGDGTKFISSAFTMANPGTTGNVLTSDGTNWTSAAPSGGGSGTVTNVATTSPITGGPITTTGTITLDHTVDLGMTTSQSVTVAPAANTFGDGFVLQDTTAASSGNQQYSPSLHFQGQGWKTASTAASQAVDFRVANVPVQGTTNPSGQLQFAGAVNGGSYTTAMKIGTGGGVSFGSDAPPSSAGLADFTIGFTINNGATANTIPVADGIKYFPSSWTLASPGASGQVLLSDGTNWTSGVPTTLNQTAGITNTNSSGVIQTAIAAPSGAIVGTTDTQTLTNKRRTKRVGTTASSATPTINTDNVDEFTITALATGITSMTTNLSGTPNEGDTLLIWIKDNGTPQTIAWGSSFGASSNPGAPQLPTTTTAGKYQYSTFIWNNTASKWFLTGTLDGF